MNKNENLSAILGPTNTGKTYLAFERLLSYKSGIFGFPLRLLARENYDKAVKRIGLNHAALITGEEKILPKEARFYFCTVESMPKNLNTECVIIDEIQLAADYERGHIFTDHILNTRGNFETIFLGALTVKQILIKMFPFIKIEQRDRLSKLSYLPKQNLSKIKPRTAVIAFNINRVYEIAENLRTHRGGAAVVLGSLSPRTRNAQVDVYENNKVDFLVATDAIGMGLNLSINHVAFSSLEKFDGRYNRNLLAPEISQIAGRAGRYKNNGTFGITKEAGFLDPTIIQSVENHEFNSIQKIYWRNSNIDFSSVESVLSSLKKFPIKNYFFHKKNAEDEVNFKNLISDNAIKDILNSEEHIKLLWDVCRIPDFQKIFNDSYLDFLKTIFLLIINNDNKIPETWLEKKILLLENFDGGIAELSGKISQIRTWTYISNHQKWLIDPVYWQEKTHKIENDLSDNLHINLTNRFVDFTSRYFINANNEGIEPSVKIDNNRNFIINEKKYGKLNGFTLKLDQNVFSHSLFSLSHVKKSIRNMIEDKVSNFLNAPNDSINLGNINSINLKEKIKLFWGDEQIGFLSKGNKIYSPVAEAFNSEYLSSENKLLVSSKLQNWLDLKIEDELKLLKNAIDDNISSQTRAITYNVFEKLGTLKIDDYINFLKNIDSESKSKLSKLGIRIGAKYFFMPNLLKKSSMELCAVLWSVFNNSSFDGNLPLPKDGRVSFIPDAKMPEEYWSAIGYINLNNFALRVDVFERIFFMARQKIKKGPFLESADLMNPVGCNSNQLKDILIFCGFSSIKLGNEKKLFFITPKTHTLKTKKVSKKNIIIKSKKVKDKKTELKKNKPDPNSPFAVLEKLL